MASKIVLALIASGMLAAFPGYAAAQSVQSSVDLNTVVSRRQVVDMLLNEALHIYKSPARVSTAGFTAKMPSNMELVTDRLLQAYKLEPYRTDLLISAANAQIYNSQIDRAVQLFEQAHQVAPDDIDINSYLATWAQATGNEKDARNYLAQVAVRNPGRAADIRSIFERIDRISATPLQEQPTAEQLKAAKGGKRAIVTLGYALNPDGTMHKILEGRLEKTLELAKADPETMIIVTGGVPQNGQTEGKLMANWLVERGIARDRIIEENYATSTVDNALYSAYALARQDISNAILISSASHVRRGQTLLEIACSQICRNDIKFISVSYPDKPLAELAKVSKGEALGIYRDALRTYGMWSYRSAPLIER